MITPVPTRQRKHLACLGMATLLMATTATAQRPAQVSDRDSAGQYQQEVQACRSGATSQDPASCLMEARNAQSDKKRGLLGNGNGDFQANALARCQVLNGDDKMACQDRMRGGGKVTGSVAGGGVLREIETVVPAGRAP
jgi:hypothetical protein